MGTPSKLKEKAQKINKKILIIISLHRKFKSHFAKSTKMKDMQEISGCACMGYWFIQVMRFTGLKNCICLKLLFSKIIINYHFVLVNWLVLIPDEASNTNEQKYTDCTQNCKCDNLHHCCNTLLPLTRALCMLLHWMKGIFI